MINGRDQILMDLRRFYRLNYTFAFEFLFCLTTDFFYSFIFGSLSMLTCYIQFVVYKSQYTSNPMLYFATACIGIFMTCIAGYLLHLSELKEFVAERI